MRLVVLVRHYKQIPMDFFVLFKYTELNEIKFGFTLILLCYHELIEQWNDIFKFIIFAAKSKDLGAGNFDHSCP